MGRVFNIVSLLLFFGVVGAELAGQVNFPLDMVPDTVDEDTSRTSPVPAGLDDAVEFEDIRDIRGPVSIPNPWTPYLIAAGVLAGLVILFFLIRALIRKLRQKPEPIPISPYEQALQELDATRPLMKAGQDKAFSIAVSDAVRNFLERQFDMPAPESTTEEFLFTIRDHPLIKGPLADNFSRFLQLCDLAKFARYPLGLSGMEDLLASGQKLVEETYVKHKMRVRLLAEAKKIGKGGVQGTPKQSGEAPVLAKS